MGNRLTVSVVQHHEALFLTHRTWTISVKLISRLVLHVAPAIQTLSTLWLGHLVTCPHSYCVGERQDVENSQVLCISL